MSRSLPLVVVLTLAAAGSLAAQSTTPPTTTPKPAAQDTTHAARTTSHAATPSASTHHVMNASHRASADDIRMAQEKLATLKLYAGKATGRSTRAFVAALKKYQQQNGLKVTGQLDDSTLAKLRAAQ